MSSKCNKIRHIVRIRQMLKQWRRKARMSASCAPPDVPSGHVAVYVGTNRRRFVVRLTYLNHPIFRRLLVQAEEEYGYRMGPLTLPCDEVVFEEILRVISGSDSGNWARYMSLEDFQRCCHVGMMEDIRLMSESRPLLDGFADKPVC